VGGECETGDDETHAIEQIDSGIRARAAFQVKGLTLGLGAAVVRDFAIELGRGPRYWSFVRRNVFWAIALSYLTLAVGASAATGRVIKVLPHFLDLKGQHALSPSLFDRDAYQAYLRLHPLERSGIRFDVQWKMRGSAWEQLKVRVEMRGSARGAPPVEEVLEQVVEPAGWFSKWASLSLTGDEYRRFGELTAWRVTLWEGKQLLGERKSFLW
jgi:hypothetical protein